MRVGVARVTDAQSDMQTPGAASHLDTINMIEWNKMLRETNLMDVYLTEVVSRQIFSSAQMVRHCGVCAAVHPRVAGGRGSARCIG